MSDRDNRHAPAARKTTVAAHESLQRDEPVTTPSERSFGLVFAALFLLIACYPLLYGRGPWLWSLALAAAFALAAWAAPRLLAPLNFAWTRLGLLLHKTVSPLVLGFMFFGVVTPIGVLMRVLGKDPLHLRFDPDAESYWIERIPPGPDPDSLRDQF